MRPTIARTLRHRLSGGDWQRKGIFERLDRHFERCRMLVRVFYVFLSYYVYMLLGRNHALASQTEEFDHLWPLAWVEGLNLVTVMDILGTGAFLAAIGSALWRDAPALRTGAAVLVVPVAALQTSLGTIHHADHMVVWMTIALAFLPRATERRQRAAYCFSVAWVQGLILTFYTMAGFHKFKAGLVSLLQGEEGNLAPRGLAITLAERSEQTGTDPLLAGFLIENYWLSWPLFLIVIYVQLTAVVAVFRPSAQIVVGLVLVAFHLGTFLMMEITFPSHIFILLLLVVFSPFAPDRAFGLHSIAAMPGMGWLNRLGRAQSIRPVAIGTAV